MKTIVVLSDTHGRCAERLQKLMPIFSENHFLIHLGDGSNDMKSVFSRFPQKTYVLKGNCDFSYGENELVFSQEGVSLFCCHGHQYHVKYTLHSLEARAKELGCSVAVYGHTHVASIETVDGVLCINPGALSSYVSPSYAYLVLHQGKISATIVPIS